MSYRIDQGKGKPQDAMLTEYQREFLRSDKSGYSDQNKRDYRNAIADRVYNSLLDFELLFENWKESEREKVFKETQPHKDLSEGVRALIAMVYMANRFESGMEMLLSRAVSKAESEMAGSNLYFPKRVELRVEKTENEDYVTAIDKFRRRDLSDMSDGEAQAILRLLDRSRTVTAEDLEEMRNDFSAQLEEMWEELADGGRNRQKYTREKQLHYREIEENEEES